MSVVSLKDYKEKRAQEHMVVKCEPEVKEEVEEQLTFEEIMERNKKNEERLKRERAKANKDVKRSHNLDNTDRRR